MQVFKRASTAYAAAGDQPLLRIGCGKDAVYIVGIERLTSVELISAPYMVGSMTSPSRRISGQIGLGHLDRLGNANGAYAAELPRENTFDLHGLMHRYHKPEDQAIYDEQVRVRREGEKV